MKRKAVYRILLVMEKGFVMDKFVPYDKMSKKKKKELNAQKRGDWGSLNPVTRTSKNKKAYNRRKARRIDDNFNFVPFPLWCGKEQYE